MDLTEQNLPSYLRHKNWLGKREPYRILPLSGGNLNYLFRVDTPQRSFVVKQAREKIKLLDHLQVPRQRVEIERNALHAFKKATQSRSVPELYDYDVENFVLIMEAVPPTYTLFTYELLAGNVNLNLPKTMARFYAQLHTSTYQNRQLQQQFASMEMFDTFKIGFFHKELLQKVSSTAYKNVFNAMEKCHQNRICLIHADSQPKNMLVNGDHFYLLDYELSTFGDPAFDVGNILAHYILVAIINYPLRERYFKAMNIFWREYQRHCSFPFLEQLQRNALQHFAPVIFGRTSSSIKISFIESKTRNVAEKVLLSLAEHPPQNLLDVFTIVEKYGKPLAKNKPITKTIQGVYF